MIQIISPHIDDAFLSLGGFIEKRIKEEKIVVNNIFTISTWINSDALIKSEYTLDKINISKIRKKEEMGVAKLIGFEAVFYDFDDFPLRGEGYLYNDADICEMVATALLQKIDKSDICIFPVGLFHPDHEIVKKVSNRFLELGYSVLYYEDLPYAAWECHDYETTFKNLQGAGYAPQNYEIDIERKLSTLRFYESQVSEEFLNSVKSYSYSLQDSKFYERLWSKY